MQRANTILWRATHDRGRVVSICVSWRSLNLAKVSWIFSTHCSTDDKQCEVGPTGDPNKLKPPLVTGISGGKALLEREISAEVSAEACIEEPLFKITHGDGLQPQLLQGQCGGHWLNHRGSHQGHHQDTRCCIRRPGTVVLIMG